ncbi:MAG: hypothetical protein QOE73_2240 [Verrucomicrobiota bacterium]
MADQQQVRRLREGVATWNAWQLEVLEPADLSGADLKGADLSGIYLIKADLSRADLRDSCLVKACLAGASLRYARLDRANLKEANLRGAEANRAILEEANLEQVNLEQADLELAKLPRANLERGRLEEANLRGANLERANLTGAKLARTDLTGASLIGANLRDAILVETVLVNIDLRNAIGVEQCSHYGPSLVDFRTLQKSGQLPLSFLRGVGLPDNVIEYLPSLINAAIQYYSCFISYSHKDEDFAQRLHADLQNAGVRCWFAPHDLPIGSKILDEIDAAIRLRDKLILILSERSIGSDWVEDEVKTAFEEERQRRKPVLFPVRLDDCIMETKEAWAAKLRADRHIGDFRQWKSHDEYQKTLERVLRDLKTILTIR